MLINEANVYLGERGYVQLVKDVLEKGVSIPDRTGVGSKAMFGATVIYDKLENGLTDFALSTSRPCPLRLAFEEIMFFLRGETDTKKLEEKGIFFWNGNTTREFLNNRNMKWCAEGDLGAAYSSQWRRAGDFSGVPPEACVDQLSKLLETLKHDKYSRRMVVDLWNPVEEYAMPITPCWAWSQWIVIPGEDGKDYLHLSLVNRSLDALFGYPYSVQQYRLLQYMLCKMFGFEMGQMRVCLSHTHLYNSQLEYATEFVERDFGVQGQVEVNKEIKSLEDLLSVEWTDIVVSGLEVNNSPFKAKKPPMAV